MVAACDAEAGADVVEDGPEEGFAGKGCAGGEVETVGWDEDNEGGVEPIDLLIPVVDGYILVLDVCGFLGWCGCWCACWLEQAWSRCGLSHGDHLSVTIVDDKSISKRCVRSEEVLYRYLPIQQVGSCRYCP